MPQSGASNLEIIVGWDDSSVHFYHLQAVARFPGAPARTFSYRFILPGLWKRRNIVQRPGYFFFSELMI
jgi:hypothetical protein